MPDAFKHEPSHTELVWDSFIRLFHWSLVFGFLLNYFVVEDNNPLHEWIGYYILILICLRIIWGFIGSHHARFKSFIPSPKTLHNYLSDLLRRKEREYDGHNPAGAIMILLLLMLMITICTSGWMMGLDRFWGIDWIEDLHYYSSKGLLYFMIVHIAGVIYASIRHKNNLVKVMIIGHK